MRKLLLNLTIFFHYLMRGLKNADAIAFEGKTSEAKDGTGIEETQETKNVYKDLLRGELTQEVKELRHEMYYTERASKKYVYNGNGTAVKKTISEYAGSVENEDNDNIYIIQNNRESNGTLSEFGIFVDGEDVSLINDKITDFSLKSKRDFTIKINRMFYPRHRIEEFASKIVIKLRDNNPIIDIYTPQYEQQFNRRHTLFINEMNKIYNGDSRNDIVNFDNLNFIAFNSYGSDDLKYYEFNNVKFSKIIKYDGSFILRFDASFLTNGEDLIEEFFDPIADEKNKNHAPREGAVIDMATVMEINERNNYDVETAEALMKEMNT